MRMWMINPSMLCNKHLLGEHGEIHKHKHNFEKHHNIKGRIYPITQIEPKNMQLRHDILAKELINRGMNHNSSYIQPNINYLPENLQNAKVDINISIKDLKNRCNQCKLRIETINRKDQYEKFMAK